MVLVTIPQYEKIADGKKNMSLKIAPLNTNFEVLGKFFLFWKGLINYSSLGQSV